MGTVADVLREKGPRVHVVGPKESVLDAAKRMNEHRIGALIVVDAANADGHGVRAGQVVGIITERDMLTRIIAAGLDPAKTLVERVMSSPVVTCSPSATLDEVRAIMRQRRIRHVPVSERGDGKEGGRLLGVVSIGDVNAAETKVMVRTIEYLEQYMYHG